MTTSIFGRLQHLRDLFTSIVNYCTLFPPQIGQKSNFGTRKLCRTRKGGKILKSRRVSGGTVLDRCSIDLECFKGLLHLVGSTRSQVRPLSSILSSRVDIYYILWHINNLCSPRVSNIDQVLYFQKQDTW
jgi:ribosomal protein L34